MLELDETTAVHQVFIFLCEKHSTIDRDVIQDIVTQEHCALTGPIRTFIPVLVQRAAGERLRTMSHTPERISA